MTGYGTKEYKNGGVYKGMFKNGKFNGMGELIKEDGTV